MQVMAQWVEQFLVDCVLPCGVAGELLGEKKIFKSCCFCFLGYTCITLMCKRWDVITVPSGIGTQMKELGVGVNDTYPCES
jgi:hypothetical protein